MKTGAPLFAKIMAWFFLNLVLVAAALAVFFAFQPHVNLHAVFGQQGKDRMKTAGMLIANDLWRTPQDQWSEVLARHAEIHGVDFIVVFRDGSRYSSAQGELPVAVKERVRQALRDKPVWEEIGPPPRMRGGPRMMSRDRGDQGPPEERIMGRRPPRPHGEKGDKWYFRMRTRNPTRYWSGIHVPRPFDPLDHPLPAMFLAVSDSMTGNGFFFDPLPWMVVAAVIFVISVLLWIPMVRSITRPLGRMTRATEEIANGRFDVSISEPRRDEIGRLARAINHMTARLSAYVNGQKRFLGDVAHELGSPIARIQFGLGALEQRVEQQNRQRVVDVMEDIDHMSNLVGELMAFSRADLKSKAVELERIELLPVVQTAVKREKASSAEIVVDIDPQIRVVAAKELLTRAMSNLVRNAVKHAGSAGPINISTRINGDLVNIEVRDRGPGVPDAVLDQLFEPFFRPEPSRDRDSGGVGLGLAIVKTCIKTCGGTVLARNLQPSGFAVAITLKG